MVCAISGCDGGKGERVQAATKDIKNGLNGLKRGAAHAIGLETCSKFARVEKASDGVPSPNTPSNGESESGASDGESEEASKASSSSHNSFCCCARYRECKLRGRCKTKCTFVRRIWDDDDGVTVDVVQQGDKLVAYKSYHLCHDELFHQRILDEIETFNRMGGRNHTIPLLESFYDHRGALVLVFPYIEDTKPADAQVQGYMRQLLEALSFLHGELGIMHRNIKRDNILFDRRGKLTLIDMEDCLTFHPNAHYPLVGNGRYRSPEMRQRAKVFAYNGAQNRMSGVNRYNEKTDIFSAGVTFAELLLDRHRFFDDMHYIKKDYQLLKDRLEQYRESPPEIFEPWISHSKPWPSLLTPVAADLLMRMLCFDPAKRLSAAEALAHPYLSDPVLTRTER